MILRMRMLWLDFLFPFLTYCCVPGLFPILLGSNMVCKERILSNTGPSIQSLGCTNAVRILAASQTHISTGIKDVIFNFMTIRKLFSYGWKKLKRHISQTKTL